MKRSAVVTVGLMMASVTLVACSSEPDHSQVCYDEKTQKRVEDDDCRNNRGGTRWFYIPRTNGAPPVGEQVDTSKGSFVRPTTGRVGTVSRGGFGGRAGSGTS